jgi:hypothetical protein
MVLTSGYPVRSKILFLDCESKYAWILVNEQGDAVDVDGNLDAKAQLEWERDQRAGIKRIPRLINTPLTTEQYKELGISFVVAYSLWDNRNHVFMPSALNKLDDLIKQSDEVVGFMSFRFDDNLLSAHGVKSASTYDFALEARKEALYPFKGGYGDSLSAYGELNFVNPRPSFSSGFGYLQQLARRGNRHHAFLNEFVIDASTADLLVLVDLYIRRHLIYVPGYTDRSGEHIMVSLPEFATVSHDEVAQVDAGLLPPLYCGKPDPLFFYR